MALFLHVPLQLLPLPDTVAEIAERAAKQGEVFAVVIADKAGAVQAEAALWVNERLVHVHRDDLGEEQVMGAERDCFFDTAFDIHRALHDQRGFYRRGRGGRQARGRELVRVPARFHAAEVGRAEQPACHQVDDELFLAGNDAVGISLGPHGDREHGRLGIHGAGPGYGDDVGRAFFVGAGHHYNRHGIEYC